MSGVFFLTVDEQHFERKTADAREMTADVGISTNTTRLLHPEIMDMAASYLHDS